MTKATEQAKFLVRSLSHLDDQFLDCRDPSLGHDWKKIEDFHVVPATTTGRKTTHVARKFQCKRCSRPNSPTIKTERYIVVRREGAERLERISVGIEYVEGYLLPGVPRGVKPAEIVRAEQYRRAMERAVKAKRGQRATAER